MLNKESNTEQFILEAAERLFLDKGFAMTSTTEIAKEVGCNQALVHYYFRTKEKLFQAIFEKKAKLFFATLFQLSEDNVSFEEKLRRIIEAHFDMIRANPKLPFLFFNESTTNPERLESIARKKNLPKSFLRRFNMELQAEIDKGNIRPIGALDLFLSIVSLNVILFLSAPVFKSVLKVSDEVFEEMIANRKKENVFTILRSLKP